MPCPPYTGQLSVVIPAHNEAGNLAALVDEVAQALAGVDYEIIVVDDGSDDATAALLRQCAQPGVRWVRHARPCGQSQAVTSGVRAARHAWIATLDGDGQNDPADLPRLLARLVAPAASAGLALVCGWRQQRHDHWPKRLSSRIANAVRARLLGDATPDSGCGLKLFGRETFLALPNFDHMHRFLPALVQRAGGAVISVPVCHRPRRRGRSHYGIHNRLWVGLIDLAGVAWLQRRVSPPCANAIETGEIEAGEIEAIAAGSPDPVGPARARDANA